MKKIVILWRNESHPKASTVTAADDWMMYMVAQKLHISMLDVKLI